MLEGIKFVTVILGAVYVMTKLISPLVVNTKEIATKVDKLAVALNSVAASAVTHRQCEKHRKDLVAEVEGKIKVHELECEK